MEFTCIWSGDETKIIIVVKMLINDDILFECAVIVVIENIKA